MKAFSSGLLWCIDEITEVTERRRIPDLPSKESDLRIHESQPKTKEKVKVDQVWEEYRYVSRGQIAKNYFRTNRKFWVGFTVRESIPKRPF